MRTRKRGEHQIADVGVPRMHRQLVAVLDRAPHLVDVGEIQPRMHALGIQVQGQIDDVEVAGAFAIAEQTAFDAVAAGHQGELA